jgi:hypothetical protein
VLLSPLLVFALVAGQLWLAGVRNVGVVAANLEVPRLSSGRRVVDLVAAAEPRARVFDVTLGAATAGDVAAERVAATPSAADVAGNVRVQLASEGQTRILIVRDGDRDGSRWNALADVLRGRARLAIVADRGWLDLGPLPPHGHERRVQIVGLLGGSYSFQHLVTPPADVSPLVLDMAGWGGAGLLPPLQAVRFELVTPHPLGMAEVLTRVLLFVEQSAVLAVAGALAVLAFVIGWLTLDRSRHQRAAFLLLSSAVLGHAVLLPPLQGADETSHAATVEGLVARGAEYRWSWYPASIATVAAALDQDRVQQQPAEALPLRDDAERAALVRVLSSPLAAELQRAGTPPPGASGQPADARAPAFYQVFRIFGPIAPLLSIADRLAMDRLTSVAMALVLLGAGLVLLVACGLGDELGTAYCALFTFPYAVIALASCSNYAPAIGCGGIVGAAAVAAVLAPDERARRASRIALLAAVWLGVALWRDFALGAVLLTAVIALGVPPFDDRSVRHGSDHPVPGPRRAWRLALAAVGVLDGALVLWLGLDAFPPGRVARMAAALRQPESWLYVLALAPLALAVCLVALDRRHRARPPERRRRDAIALTLSCVAAVLVLWILVPSTRVPYETTFLRGWAFLSTATATVLSTNLSWDQDRLTWKFVLGAGGWHDVFFPDAVYAVARWLAVAVLLALPILSLRCRLRRPRIAAALLLLAGIGLTLMATSLALRHAAFAHPHGRFALPWLALALLPVVARVRSGDDRVPRLVLRGAVLFHVWASFVVVGLRYALGS